MSKQIECRVFFLSLLFFIRQRLNVFALPQRNLRFHIRILAAAQTHTQTRTSQSMGNARYQYPQMRINRTVTHAATAKWNEPRKQATGIRNAYCACCGPIAYYESYSIFPAIELCVVYASTRDAQYETIFSVRLSFSICGVTLQLHSVHRCGKLIFHFAPIVWPSSRHSHFCRNRFCLCIQLSREHSQLDEWKVMCIERESIE